MIKHTIYLQIAHYEELTRTAKRLGIGLNDVIRNRLNQDSSSAEIQKIAPKIDSIFALLDYIAGDLGFVVGATRAGCRSSEKHTREGEFYEANYKRIAGSMKPLFELKETQERSE